MSLTYNSRDGQAALQSACEAFINAHSGSASSEQIAMIQRLLELGRLRTKMVDPDEAEVFLLKALEFGQLVNLELVYEEAGIVEALIHLYIKRSGWFQQPAMVLVRSLCQLLHQKPSSDKGIAFTIPPLLVQRMTRIQGKRLLNVEECIMALNGALGLLEDFRIAGFDESVHG